jgi:plastocyanin domain-containing protein
MIDNIIVTLGGIFISIFIYWFFLGKKDSTTIAGSEIKIIVDGGYSPSVIQIKLNSATNLNFFRKDPSSCLEEIVLPDFGKKAYLPLNQTTTIQITPQKVGEFEISCGMNMFHGKIIVKD